MHRTVALAFLFALMLSFTPVHAEEEEEKTEELGHPFGQRRCNGAFICPHLLTEKDSMNNYYTAIFNKANRCIRKGFSMIPPNGSFFEDNYPNSQGYLITKELPHDEGRAYLSPSCRIVSKKQNPNLCSIICTLNETR